MFDAVLDRSAERDVLVIEPVYDTSLTSIVDQRRPLPLSWAVAVAAQVCIVMRTQSPSYTATSNPTNVLVSEDGAASEDDAVTVLDLGIAAVLDDDFTRLTATGMPRIDFARMQQHVQDAGRRADPGWRCVRNGARPTTQHRSDAGARGTDARRGGRIACSYADLLIVHGAAHEDTTEMRKILDGLRP